MLLEKLFLVSSLIIIIKISEGNLQDSKRLPEESVCGLGISALDRIVGGKQVMMGEFPWIVALEFRKRVTKTYVGILCGGTLINNRYILTAAHCLTNKHKEVFQVRLGEWNATSDPDCTDYSKTDCNYVQLVEVEKVVPHPFYNGRTKNNDIGLIRLKTDVEYSDFIRPICLTSMDSPLLTTGLDLVVAGWGANEYNYTSEVLLKVSLPYVTNTVCRQMLNTTLVRLNHMCAGGVQGKDACEGDSGGPIMSVIQKPNGDLQWYQEGIVAWGRKCGFSKPAVYTKVKRYIYWIKLELE